MICPDCYLGYMLHHDDTKLRHQNWRKCPLCAFCCKEDDLVQYRENGKSEEIQKLREIAGKIKRRTGLLQKIPKRREEAE